MRSTFLALFSLLLALPACGDDTGGAGGSGSGTGTGGEDIAPIGTGGGGGDAGPVGAELDPEVCEHLTEGPYVEHTATDALDTAPDVSAEHTAHTITLVDFAGQNGGYVAFQAPAAGEYLFYLDADLPLSIQSSAGGDVPIEASCNPTACSDACTAIVGRHLVDLEVGTYYLELGPTLEDSVNLAHEAVGEHAE